MKVQLEPCRETNAKDRRGLNQGLGVKEGYSALLSMMFPWLCAWWEEVSVLRDPATKGYDSFSCGRRANHLTVLLLFPEESFKFS